MSTTAQLRTRLISKLKEQFQLDQPDLDFGFYRISTQDYGYDTIYVNGSNNLPNLKQGNQHWKIRLIEEEFMQRMWKGKQ